MIQEHNSWIFFIKHLEKIICGNYNLKKTYFIKNYILIDFI